MDNNYRIAYYAGGVILLAVMIAVLLFRNPPASVEPPPSKTAETTAHLFQSPSKENVSREYSQRVEMLKKSIDVHPENAVHLAALARLLMDGHQTGQAATYFERAIKIQPKNDSILFDLSVCYYTLGQYQRSLDLTDRILTRSPNNTVAFYNKGALSATMGNRRDAERSWKKLIAVAPQSEEAQKAKSGLAQLGKVTIP